MGGIFGKHRRPCVLPRAVFRARRAARVCCDASTWTGDSHVRSARLGRTPRRPQPPAATMVLEASGSEFGEEEGDSASPPREPEGKPHPELLERQELPGEAQGPQNPQESSEAEAALHPPGSSLSPEPRCGDPGVAPLARTTVEVDVHVSADHGEPGQGQAAAESELLGAAGQEAGAAGAAESACVGQALGEAPTQEAGDSTAASCPLEEPELPLEAAEAGEAMADGQGAAQEQGAQETGALPDLQLGQGETDAPEGVRGAAGGAGQEEEMAEACGDEESPACLPDTQQEEQSIQISEGEPEEH